MVNLTVGEESSDSFTWGRTHAAIPAGAREKPLSLTIGGFGLFDHRFMRVFINGDEVATRRATGRWHEPLTIDLGLGSKAHRSVRFGQDNVIAVQLSDFFKRPARLEELDPMHGRELPASLDWPGSPAQFEQYLTIGKPYRSMQWKPARLLSKKEGLIGEAIFELTSKAGDLTALVTYRWNATDPVLQKTTTLINRGTVGVRVLNVRLGEYTTGITVSDGEQGFPVYVDGELFMSLAHPYGWAIGQSSLAAVSGSTHWPRDRIQMYGGGVRRRESRRSTPSFPESPASPNAPDIARSRQALRFLRSIRRKFRRR
jgi:hypothetical protein